ncbi:MAG: outer membrane lipoprotein carrier protein LolA [Chitinophagales bacterium]|nr:outer membrane lipoprotein carrier protein LolA [Chitinophagales bacterium]
MWGQTNALDAEADVLLKNVIAKYKKYTTSKMDILLTVDIPDSDEDEKIDLTAWLKGDKFKIDMADQMFVSDNVTIWNYLKEFNEVQINNYDQGDAMFSPSIIFNLYAKDYLYRIKEEYKNSAGKLIKVIELTPVKKDNEFFKIDLKVENDTYTIVEAKIYERSGYRYIYKIKSFTPNVPLTDDFFKFDTSKYKDIEIIDARF